MPSCKKSEKSNERILRKAVTNERTENSEFIGSQRRCRGSKKEVLPFVTTNYSNYTCKNIVRSINDSINNQIHDEDTNTIFHNTTTVISQKQPPNILRLLSKSKFKPENSIESKENDIFIYTMT